MHTGKYVLIIITYSMLFISCSTKERVPFKESKSLISVTQLSDSSFISKSLTNFEVYKDKIYFSDTYNSRICCIDSNLNIINIYGSPGRGPGEFMYPDYFSIHNDSIYVSDPITHKIIVFALNNSSFSREFYLEDKQFIHRKFFIDEKNHFYISTAFSDYPITVYDLMGRIIKKIGDKYETTMTKNERAKEMRHLLLLKNTLIISVMFSKPYIELYNLNGGKIIKHDISQVDIVNDVLDYFGESKPKSLGVPTIFDYAVLDGNNIYLSLLRKYKGSITYDNILELEINNISIVPKLKYKLLPKEDNYNGLFNFCVWKKKFIAYDSFNQNLNVFEK